MKNKQLLTIFLIVFIDLLGFGLILPLLPFIGEKYGSNAFQIGLLTATYSLFQLIASPILGRLSDRYGRKKLLIISQAGTFVGFLLLGFARSLPLIFLSRIIDGATGGNISIAQAYISDVTTKENRAKGMGVLGAAFGLGFIFGPALGGLLSRFSYSTPAFFAASVSFITMLVTTFFLKESVDVKNTVKSVKTKFSLGELKKVLYTYPIGLLIISFFILNLAFSIMQGNFSLFTQQAFGFGPTQNGLMFAYIGVMAVLVQLRILPYILKKWSEKKIFIDSSLVMALGLFTIILAINPFLLIISLTLIPLGNGLSNPVVQSLASENVPPEDYGGTLGILQSSGSLGRIFGPIAGGFMFNTFNKNIPFIVAAIMVFGVYFYLREYYK
jgi:MFS transporter, DHA1 family, tetracycline resistance protein